MMISPVTIVATAGIAVAGTGIAVGVVAPPDWAGIAQVITAGGVLITALGSLITGVLMARQKKDVEDTKAVVMQVKETAEKTAVAVDGGMTKLLDAKDKETAAKVELATVQATLDEKAAQSVRRGVADAAILKEKERVSAEPSGPAASPLSPVPVAVVNAGDTSLKVTEEKK